jgi:hypothetical protein
MQAEMLVKSGRNAKQSVSPINIWLEISKAKYLRSYISPLIDVRMV